jgi:type IV secretion system protein VirB4
LFELGLGEVALAFTAASSKSDQAAIANILAEHGREGFAAAWLRHKGLDWGADLLAPKQDRSRELVHASLEVTP